MKNEIRELMTEVETELANALVPKPNWANVLGPKQLSFEDWMAKTLLAAKVQARKERMDAACAK